MDDIHAVCAVRGAYEALYAGLVLEFEPSCGDRAEAERSVQTAFLLALRRPRAFALNRDQLGWLRDTAGRAVRTQEQAPASRGFEELLDRARRRQRRRTVSQFAAVLVVTLFAIATFVVFGLHDIPTWLN